MRAALVLIALLLVGITFAQEGYSGKELTCRKTCCNSGMGEWNDAAQYCQPATDDYDNYLGYQDCVTSCTEDMGGGFCCLPIFGLVGVLGLAAYSQARK